MSLNPHAWQPKVSTHILILSQVCQELMWSGRIILSIIKILFTLSLGTYTTSPSRKAENSFVKKTCFSYESGLLSVDNESFSELTGMSSRLAWASMCFFPAGEEKTNPNTQTDITPALRKICPFQHQTQGWADSIFVSFCLFISQKSESTCSCLYS